MIHETENSQIPTLIMSFFFQPYAELALRTTSYKRLKCLRITDVD